MTVIPITCDNCGAKYKLPPTFKGAQAKCQKCGSVIDVASQRAAMEGADDGAGTDKPAAAARPAKARPAAAAKPAVDRSKRAGAASSGSRRAAKADDGKAAAGGRAGRSRRGGDDDGDGGDRRRGQREQKKGSPLPLVLSLVGLVVIGGGVAFFMMQDDEPAKKDQQTQKNAAVETPTSGGADGAGGGEPAAAGSGAAPAMPKPGAGGEGTGGDTTSSGAADGSAADGASQPDDGSNEASPDATESGRLFPDLPKDQREPWMNQRFPARTIEDVQAASEQFGELQWPDSISAERKAEIQGIAEDLEVDGGIRSIRARNKLIEEGYAGLFGIVEKLRTLDYRRPDDAAYGFALNKAMEEITGGLNARYQAVQAGEQIHPAKAQWNTKTVGAWIKMLGQWPDEATFQADKRNRATKDG